MTQPVPPVAPLPGVIPSPGAITAQNAPSQVDVATGPLPQPTAADAATFKNATAAGSAAANKVQEVDMQRLAPASEALRRADKGLSNSFNAMSDLEKLVHQSLRHFQELPPSQAADRSAASSEDPASENPGSDGPSSSIEQLRNEIRKVFEDNVRMTEFGITVSVMANGSSRTLGTVKELITGGGG